jgi:hypothetical protein
MYGKKNCPNPVPNKGRMMSALVLKRIGAASSCALLMQARRLRHVFLRQVNACRIDLRTGAGRGVLIAI